MDLMVSTDTEQIVIYIIWRCCVRVSILNGLFNIWVASTDNAHLTMGIIFYIKMFVGKSKNVTTSDTLVQSTLPVVMFYICWKCWPPPNSIVGLVLVLVIWRLWSKVKIFEGNI